MVLDKKYQRYAKDVLTALIDQPSGTGTAAGPFVPYVRYEMPYMEEELPAPKGSFTDLATGKITVDQFHQGSEIHEMAYAVRDAITASLPKESTFTVEATIERDPKGFGHNVQFFIYSDNHMSVAALQKDLKQNRGEIFMALQNAIDNRPVVSHAGDPNVNFDELRKIIHDSVMHRMQLDHLDMAHKKPEEPKIVVDHFLFTAEAVLFSQVEQYLDARDDKERAVAQKMMIESYERAAATSREFGLRSEFRNKGRLDVAVGVVHDYLQSINGTPSDHAISYTTAKRKTVSGQRLMEYFLDDIKTEAYQHVFKELGIELPHQPPGHRRAG